MPLFTLIYTYFSSLLDAVPGIRATLDNVLPSVSVALQGLPSSFTEFTFTLIPTLVALAIIRWIT